MDKLYVEYAKALTTLVSNLTECEKRCALLSALGDLSNG